jgi:hypothetical protein
VQQNWRPFEAEVASSGDPENLPRFVKMEFEAFLRCGILAHGFVHVRCGDCAENRLVAFSCKRRGFCPSCIGRRMNGTAASLVDRVMPAVPVRQWVLTVPHGLRYAMAHEPTLTGAVLRVFLAAVSWWMRKRARQQGLHGILETGAVAVIQRFDSALALNVHFHSLLIDGVYTRDGGGPVQFHPVAAPSDQDVAAVAARVYRRVARLIDDEADGDPAAARDPLLATLTAASLRRLVATGPRRGRPIRRLGAGRLPQKRIRGRRCAEVEGFNVHANVRVAANDRRRLETLCRYIPRPPLSDERLQERPDGTLSLRLKRPWSDGTTHLLFSPGELIEKLIPLVPRPRAHIMRYHGVLAPASGWRADVVPAAPELGPTAVDRESKPADARRKWIPWADLLQRVFLTDALACPRCGGRTQIVAAVLALDSVRAILAHSRLPTGPPLPTPAGLSWLSSPGENESGFFADPPAPDGE